MQKNKRFKTSDRIIAALQVLELIDSNPTSTTSKTLSADLGRSEATIKRDIATLRRLGVKIAYHMPQHDWEVLDYGVFDKIRVAEFLDERGC